MLDPLDLAKVTVDLARQNKKVLLTSIMGEDDRCREARRILRSNGLPAFRTLEEAVSVFMYMYNYTQNLELLYQTPEELSPELTDPTFLKGILRRAYCEGRRVLSLTESMRFLEAYKIQTVKTFVARTSEEAIDMSSELGYPVVMKDMSPEATHKSEIGAVITDVCSPLDISKSFDEIANRVRKSSATEFEGVIIQPMIRQKRYELLIGSKKDAQFGSIIIFGTGGTSAELFRDISIGFPPLNRVLARPLMENTAVYKFASSVGRRFNIELLEEVLVKFSQLVIDFPEIKEIEINPLIVDESSAVAVDARVVIDTDRMMREVADHHEHLVIAPYPKKYVTLRKLKNGIEVLLRPIKPEDETRFNAFFESLSEETMRLRFFEIIKEMSHDTLTRYCNLDYDREIAIVVEHQNGQKKIAGAVRLILDSDRKSGEFAIVVGDPWQGLGLGSKLMDHIVEIAKDMHLEKVYGYVIRDNYRMINLCSKKGFEMTILDEQTAKMCLTLPR